MELRFPPRKETEFRLRPRSLGMGFRLTSVRAFWWVLMWAVPS